MRNNNVSPAAASFRFVDVSVKLLWLVWFEFIYLCYEKESIFLINLLTLKYIPGTTSTMVVPCFWKYAAIDLIQTWPENISITSLMVTLTLNFKIKR